MLQLTVLDPVEVLQLCPERRCKWISYSAYDAKATWQLSQALQAKLKVQRTQSVAVLGLGSTQLAAALGLSNLSHAGRSALPCGVQGKQRQAAPAVMAVMHGQAALPGELVKPTH